MLKSEESKEKENYCRIVLPFVLRRSLIAACSFTLRFVISIARLSLKGELWFAYTNIFEIYLEIPHRNR